MIRAAAERCIAMFASAGSPAATAQSPAPAESAAPVPAAATGGAAVGAPGEVAVLVELVEALAGRLQVAAGQTHPPTNLPLAHSPLCCPPQAVEKSQANSSGGGAGGGGEEMEEALARVEDVEAEMAEQQVMLGESLPCSSLFISDCRVLGSARGRRSTGAGGGQREDWGATQGAHGEMRDDCVPGMCAPLQVAWRRLGHSSSSSRS